MTARHAVNVGAADVASVFMRVRWVPVGHRPQLSHGNGPEHLTAPITMAFALRRFIQEEHIKGYWKVPPNVPVNHPHVVSNGRRNRADRCVKDSVNIRRGFS